MNKPYIIPLILVLGFMLGACQQKTSTEPAHFRFISMVQYPSGVLTVKGKGKNNHYQKSFPVNYAQPLGYKKLPPGYYDISLSIHGKTLLKRTYALGRDGYYTLTSMGLLPESWDTNPQTGLYRIKYLFAGAELESANKYLPQWFVMRDNYGGSKSSAYIRFVNANPHTPKLTIKKDKSALLSGLAYPLESGMTKLKPGQHMFRFLYGKVQLAQKSIKMRAGYVYTAVIGSNKKAGENLSVQMLKNPSRTLLKSQQK